MARARLVESVAQNTGGGTRLAVLVGAKSPTGPATGNTRFIENGIHRFAKCLITLGFPADNVVVLTGEQATKTRVESTFRKLKKLHTNPSELWVVWSGPTFLADSAVFSGGTHLACCDTAPDDAEETSLALAWLSGEVREFAALRTLCFFEPRRDEALPGVQAASGIYEAKELDLFVENGKVWVWAAAAANELAVMNDAQECGAWLGAAAQVLEALPRESSQKGDLPTIAEFGEAVRDAFETALRETQATVETQSPQLWGANCESVPLLGWQPPIPENAAELEFFSKKGQSIRVVGQNRIDVERLPGFLKGHWIPDRVTPTATQFLESLVSGPLDAELAGLHQTLRETFGLTRKTMKLTAEPGCGALVTPLFDFEVSVQLDAQQPHQAVFTRELRRIADPEAMFSEQAERLFPAWFDELEVATAAPIDLEQVIDSIEALPAGPLRCEYTEPVMQCVVKAVGLSAEFRLTARTCTLVARCGQSPRALLKLFLDGRQQIEAHVRGLLGA